MGRFRREGGVYGSMVEACAAVDIVPAAFRSGKRYTSTKVVGSNVVGKGRLKPVTVAGENGQTWNGGLAFNHRTSAFAIWLENWSPEKTEHLTPAERRKREREARRIAAKLAEDEAKLIEQHQAAAAQTANALLAAATAGDPDRPHPYLVSKSLGNLADCAWVIDHDVATNILAAVVSPTGDAPQRLPGRRTLILVPLGYGGKVRTVQTISEDGTKSLLRDGEKQGSYWLPCEGEPSLIGIAEGLATALSASLIYQMPVATAIDAGNLLAAARSILLDHPDAQVVFFADNDPEKDYGGEQVNRGNHDALAAARALPSHRVAKTARFPDGVLTPMFSNEDVEIYRRLGNQKPPSDFNDLLILRSVKQKRSRADSPDRL